MSRDELLALAERVEKATGPDRALDCDIFLALNPNWQALSRDPYTRSLDAALTLVPEGASWSLYDVIGKPESVRMWNGMAFDVLVRAATPALALVAAALRAIAQPHPDNSND